MLPTWVSEGSVRKYHRAKETLRKLNVSLKAQGKPLVEITEESIKELYVKDGGLVLGDASTVHGVPAGTEAFIAEAVAEAEAPKRKKKAE